MTANALIRSAHAEDEELEELTSFIGGYMTEAEEVSYYHRLEVDEELFDRVMPVIAAFRSPPESVIEEGRVAKHRLLAAADARRRTRRRFIIAVSLVAVPVAAALVLMKRPARPVAKEPVVSPPVVAQLPVRDTSAANVPGTRPAENRTMRTPDRPRIVAAVPSPLVTDDTGSSIGTLPRPYAAHERIRIYAEVPRVIAYQRAPTIGIEPANANLSLLQRLQNGLGALWGRMKHPRGGGVQRPRF